MNEGWYFLVGFPIAVVICLAAGVWRDLLSEVSG